MSRTIGGYLVELLVKNDIDTVFGIPRSQLGALPRPRRVGRAPRAGPPRTGRGICGRRFRAAERTARRGLRDLGPRAHQTS